MQAVCHSRCREPFGIAFQMRIDIGGGGKVAVTEPFLDLLHGDAVGQQQTGTAVTKIVIANFPQAMLLQQLCKGFGEIIRRSEIVLYKSRNGLQIARNERWFQISLGQCGCTVLSQIGCSVESA